MVALGVMTSLPDCTRSYIILPVTPSARKSLTFPVPPVATLLIILGSLIHSDQEENTICWVSNNHSLGKNTAFSLSFVVYVKALFEAPKKTSNVIFPICTPLDQ